jgi:surface protein
MKNLKTILLLFLAIPSIGISQYVFSSNQELKDAVDMYVNYPSIGLDTYGEINTWDVSAITDMSELFKDHNTFNEQISNWNTSNVINMRYMFSGATSFNQNIGSWDTSNVVYMSGMFKDAHSFNQDIGNWNTSNVFDMNEMFYYATSFNQDIGYWDTSIVRDMDSMFFYAESFDQDIGSWDISAVTEMSNMFYYATSFNQDISNWDFNITSSDFFTGFLSYSGLSTNNYSEVIKKITQKYINGTYTYQVVVFGAENLKYCNPDYRQYMIDNFGWQFNDGGQLTGELSLISPFQTSIQNICENNEIEQIIYEFGGAANSASAYGLPPGIVYEIIGNTITISGTASEEISETTIYDYTIQTIENNCSSDPALINGSITINPDAEITLSTPSSTSNQFICEGESIDPITYSFGGGAVDAVVSGLPPGISASYNPISRIMTITGAPTQNIEFDTTYNYNVIALNDHGCESSELTGNISVKANAELILLSSTFSTDQIVCVNSNILDIRIQFKNSSVPLINNLPSGLISEVISTDVLRIFGSVSVGGLYAFEVIGATPNGCESLNLRITLEVQPFFSILPTQVVENPNDIYNTGGASYVKNIACIGNNDGEIKVELQGSSATTNYIYSWTGPNNYVNTTLNNHIRNLSAGIYVVQVVEAQEARGCSISQTYTITEPDPVNIITNEIRPVSCTGSNDGLISVTIDGGNENFYRNFIWEVLQEDVSCTTYTVRLRDNDNDGIFDIIDADIDNDHSVDPGKTDVNNDGMIDEANDSNYSLGTVSYQSCDGIFIQNNILRGEISANGVYQVCAIPNTITTDAKLDHDLDPNTGNIASVTISGGTASCSAGTWTKIDRLEGSSLASNLIEGIYRLTVIEGPDLNDIESNDLESLRNDPDICVFEEIYELPKDQILYGSVRVDETYCSLSSGHIDIEVNQSAGEVYFYYDGVRVPNTDVEVIAAEFGINTYRVLIQNPNSNGSFEIRNAIGCGVVVAQDLLDTNVLTPIISYTSPEFEESGTISEGSNISFTLVGNTSYNRVEWDFGDSSPVVTGETVSHQYFADGTYNVTVYVYNALGCFTTATKVINVDATASTKDYSNSITIYPNPTTSIINIEQDFTSAKVYDISGRELLKSTSKTIDLSELPSSIYLLRLYDNSNKVLGTSKVVKQ